MYSVNKKKIYGNISFVVLIVDKVVNKISCSYYYVDCKSCRADLVQICSQLVYNIDAGGHLGRLPCYLPS